jgi:hypothetical protein
MSGSWYTVGKDVPTTYRFVTHRPIRPHPSKAVAPDFQVPGENAARLRLPVDLDPSILQLASELTEGTETPEERVAAIVEHLRGFNYTRNAANQTLAEFLLTTQAGHCEFFAAGVAVLARASGVPSRLVTGFALQADEREVVVRRSDAHAWAELYLPDTGWVMVDATPGQANQIANPAPAWSQAAIMRVLKDLDGQDQWDAAALVARRLDPLALMAEARAWRGLVALLGVGAVVFALFRRRRHRSGPTRTATGTGIERLYGRTRIRLSKLGWSVPTHLPPVAAAQWIDQRADEPESAALVQLAWLYYRARLGGEGEDALLVEARALMAQVNLIGAPPF